ncbi:MAG: hypothetical protein IJT79_06060 [Ruminococcus sp.]|nr:hypothetical protein [Ruminococcus sp.]
MKKDYKLYNMIFPPFFLIGLTPWFWGASIIGNFVIDSLVLLIIILIVFKRLDFKFYIRKIFAVYGLGFAADLVGIIYLFALSLIVSELPLSFRNPNTLLGGIASFMDYGKTNVTPYTYAFLISGILLSAATIFCFNFFFVFRKKDMTRKQRLFAALMLAILTAPYTFLLRSFAITG